MRRWLYQPALQARECSVTGVDQFPVARRLRAGTLLFNVIWIKQSFRWMRATMITSSCSTLSSTALTRAVSRFVAAIAHRNRDVKIIMSIPATIGSIVTRLALLFGCLTMVPEEY